jgi:hypothetical protein
MCSVVAPMCPLLVSEEYWVSKQVLSLSCGVGKPVCNCRVGRGRWEGCLTFSLKSLRMVSKILLGEIVWSSLSWFLAAASLWM